MAVTPNYNWPLPDDTSLVKDGAEAIRDLGNAIDTTVEDLPSGGLVHIESQTFSATSAVSLNDVFSSNHKSYKMIFFTESKSTTSGLTIRLRASGSDNTTSDYSTGVPGVGEITATSWGATQVNNDQIHSITTDIFNPAHAQNTFLAPHEVRGFTTTALNELSPYTLIKRDTLIFDGLSVIVSTGSMTGLITIFAYSEG